MSKYPLLPKYPRLTINRTVRDNEYLRLVYEGLHSLSDTYGKTGHGAGSEKHCQGYASVLDIGGGFTTFAADLGLPRAAVVDISDVPRSAHEAAGTEYHTALVQDMPFADNEFELGVCFDVMEHIPTEEIDAALSEIFRVCSKRVVFSISYEHSTLNPVIDDELFLLHLTLRPIGWWIIELEAYGSVTIDKPFLIVDKP